MTQIAAFVANSSTSRAAAAKIRPRKESIARRLFTAFIAQGTNGLTCQEAEANLRLKHQTCSPRVNELAHANCIQRTDKIRNGSYVYVVVAGADFDRFANWQRTKKIKPPKAKTAPAAVISVGRITDPEQEVITRAKLYCRAYWENRPAAELDAAKNGLLDVARHIEEH